ncbi:hypothetical protein [Streptacidiphilus sp. EB103A]|uniref:hypothetical protein n=1 Tax=Streptacidiphilus sp. EB103A TaxID=3156275 RepID=UPI0035137CF3
MLDDDELIEGVFVSQAYALAPLRYRADYSDPRSYTPLEPVYEDLRSAQQRCEDELRAARSDGPQLEFQWVPNHDEHADYPAVHWSMKVRTPQVRQFLALGYAVSVVGSYTDGVALGALEHG